MIAEAEEATTTTIPEAAPADTHQQLPPRRTSSFIVQFASSVMASFTVPAKRRTPTSTTTSTSASASSSTAAAPGLGSSRRSFAPRKSMWSRTGSFTATAASMAQQQQQGRRRGMPRRRQSSMSASPLLLIKSSEYSTPAASSSSSTTPAPVTTPRSSLHNKRRTLVSGRVLERTLRKDSALRRQLEQYAAARYETENVAFLEQVMAWKRANCPVDETRRLCDTFIREGADMQVNISYDARIDTLVRAQEQCRQSFFADTPEALFDRAAQEVSLMMVNGGLFHSFVLSGKLDTYDDRQSTGTVAL